MGIYCQLLGTEKVTFFTDLMVKLRHAWASKSYTARVFSDFFLSVLPSVTGEGGRISGSRVHFITRSDPSFLVKVTVTSLECNAPLSQAVKVVQSFSAQSSVGLYGFNVFLFHGKKLSNFLFFRPTPSIVIILIA